MSYPKSPLRPASGLSWVLLTPPAYHTTFLLGSVSHRLSKCGVSFAQCRYSLDQSLHLLQTTCARGGPCCGLRDDAMMQTPARTGRRWLFAGKKETARCSLRNPGCRSISIVNLLKIFSGAKLESVRACSLFTSGSSTSLTRESINVQ